MNPLVSDKVHAAAAGVTDVSVATAKTNTSVTSNGTKNSYNLKDAAIIREDLSIFKLLTDSPVVVCNIRHRQCGLWQALLPPWPQPNVIWHHPFPYQKQFRNWGWQAMRCSSLQMIIIFTLVGHAKSWCCTRSWCCASCHRMPLGSRQLLLPHPSSNRCLPYLQGHDAAIDCELVRRVESNQNEREWHVATQTTALMNNRSPKYDRWSIAWVVVQRSTTAIIFLCTRATFFLRRVVCFATTNGRVSFRQVTKSHSNYKIAIARLIRCS